MEEISLSPLDIFNNIDNVDNILSTSDTFNQVSDIDVISCYIFYSLDNELIDYSKYDVQLNNNKLMKNELLNIIVSNMKGDGAGAGDIDNEKFKLMGIYKYDIGNLNHDGIRDFLESSDKINYLSSYNNICDIEFNQCIELFSYLNSIILIFSKTTETTPPQTIASQKNSTPINNTNTKSKNKTNKKVKFNTTNNKNLTIKR